MSLTVNNEQIPEQLIQDEMQKLKPQHDQAFAHLDEQDREKQLYKWSKENIIEKTLLKQQAAEEYPAVTDEQVDEFVQKNYPQNAGQPIPDEIKEQIKFQIQTNQLVSELAKDIAQPKDGEIEKFYNQHKEHFVIPEMVHAAHIVKHANAEKDEENKKELEEVAKKLKDGEDFAKMVEEHSDCPDNGGDLGFFPRGKMVPNFEKTVFDMEPGEISDVFQTEFGLHIAKVIEKRDSIPCELDQVKDVIVRELGNNKLQAALEKHVDKLKAKAEICED